MDDVDAQRLAGMPAAPDKGRGYPPRSAPLRWRAHGAGRPAVPAVALDHGATAAPSDQLLAVQETERRRIAVDLHDGLGPLLTLIRLEVAHAGRLLAGRHNAERDAAASLHRAEQHVARAFDELRRTVMALRPAMVDDLGIVPTLGWLVREFERSGAGIEIERELGVDEDDIPPELKIVIFRVCQEALNNIVRHAAASRARLLLARGGDALHLRIADNGRGLAGAPDDLFQRAGGGVAGIVRRVAASGGACSVESTPGGGTRINIFWPLAGHGQRR